MPALAEKNLKFQKTSQGVIKEYVIPEKRYIEFPSWREGFLQIIQNWINMYTFEMTGFFVVKYIMFFVINSKSVEKFKKIYNVSFFLNFLMFPGSSQR
jgi:hypothetical protein